MEVHLPPLDNFPNAKAALSELFVHWLSLSEPQQIVRGLVADHRDGRPFHLPSALAGVPSALGAMPAHLGPHTSPPPRSPTVNRKRAAFDIRSPKATSPRGSALSPRDGRSPIKSPRLCLDLELEHSEPKSPPSSPPESPPGSPKLSEAKVAEAKADAKAGAGAKVSQFYVPPVGLGHPIPGESLEDKQAAIDQAFDGFGPAGIAMDDMVGVTKGVCGLPSFFNAPFFERVLLGQPPLSVSDSEEEDEGEDEGGDEGGDEEDDDDEEEEEEPEGEAKGEKKATGKRATGKKSKKKKKKKKERCISKAVFERFWQQEMAPYDTVERLFRVLKQPQSSHIVREDFHPYLEELLMYHPGLDFLEGTPEFQEKYATTVITRIFYTVNRSGSGRITLGELRRSDLPQVLTVVDEEEDINRVNQYFSYEHFYVLYCKFWELDTDHDFKISRDDLIRYGNHSLTRAIVDRVFQCGHRPFNSFGKGADRTVMTYEDFIYFMLSEEDKNSPQGLRYWFRCVDLDADNVIRADEMRVFYSQQLHRMECLGQEAVPFEDVLCQMADMLHVDDGDFRMAHFTHPDVVRLSGVFFDVLFNLPKFISFEQRDPFLFRQQMAEPNVTDWDRFARTEYARLAIEEETREAEDASVEFGLEGGLDSWYVNGDDDDVAAEPVSREAPF